MIQESIYWKGERINNYEEGHYNPSNNYSPSDEMVIWLNPTSDWIKYKMDGGDYFRFVYDSSSDKLYIWNGEDGFHMDTMDATGVDGDIVGTMTKNGIDYWAGNDGIEEANKKFWEHRPDFLLDIYPTGFEPGEQV